MHGEDSVSLVTWFGLGVDTIWGHGRNRTVGSICRQNSFGHSTFYDEHGHETSHVIAIANKAPAANDFLSATGSQLRYERTQAADKKSRNKEGLLYTAN
jgi:hypothetical protein